MTEKKVAIIGLGNIGKRHLQALVKTEITMNIYCVDIRELGLDDMEITELGKDKAVAFLSNIKELPKKIDLAIIATTSAVRKAAYDALVDGRNVEYVIFEKVLFQKISDYKPVLDSLQEKGIKAWVNCGRRESKLWNDVKTILAEEKEFEFHMSGGRWGLCCNGIHMLDVIAFLDGTNSIHIDSFTHFGEPVDSKRAGFYEIYGTMCGHALRCINWSISSYDNDSLAEITIYSENYTIKIYESECRIIVKAKIKKWEEERKEYAPEYVSVQMTKIAEKILNNGDCKLTGYEESMGLHMDMLEWLMPVFGGNAGTCPIT